jgi:hypothetical protein
MNVEIFNPIGDRLRHCNDSIDAFEGEHNRCQTLRFEDSAMKMANNLCTACGAGEPYYRSTTKMNMDNVIPMPAQFMPEAERTNWIKHPSLPFNGLRMNACLSQTLDQRPRAGKK